MKNTTLQITNNWINWTKDIFAKNIDWTPEFWTIILPPNKEEINVSFEDDFCAYTFNISTKDYISTYKIETGVDVNSWNCSVVVDKNIVKYVEYEVVQKDHIEKTIDIWILPWYLIIFSCIFFLITWILFMLKVMNKKNKFLDIS